jgi:hypothetical protein
MKRRAFLAAVGGAAAWPVGVMLRAGVAIGEN